MDANLRVAEVLALSLRSDGVPERGSPSLNALARPDQGDDNERDGWCPLLVGREASAFMMV